MKTKYSLKIALCLLILTSLIAPVFAQRASRKPVIFAVLNDGKTFEPIAYVENGKLVETIDGASEQNDLTQFHKTYLKPKSAYRLIFGGADAGTATVKSSDPTAECSKNMAEIAVVSSKTKLGGMVMALATDAVGGKKANGLRRKPTPAERTEIEALVRAEFGRRKVSATARKVLRSQNLTALDVDNDKNAELAGSYWVETGATARALLFFIAEKNANGKYALKFSTFSAIKQDEVMSGDIKTVDQGTLHEVLLDVFDYDNDGVAEIFTYLPSFEGAGFNAYKARNGKWEKDFEASYYHCGY